MEQQMQEQPQPQMPPGRGPQGAPGAQQGGPSPQDIQNLQKVRQAVMTILYGDQTYQKIPQMLKGAPSPAAGIAAATLFILDLLVQESKGTMPPDMKQAAAYMLLSELTEIAGKGLGMKVGPETVQQAKQLMVQKMQAKQGQAQRAPGGQPPGAQPPGAPSPGGPPQGLLSAAMPPQ